MKSGIKVDLSKSRKQAKIIKANGCSVCASGSLCLMDGIIPDFEVAGATLVFEVID